MDSSLFARFYFSIEKSPNGQQHTPTIDVNTDGTCSYFGKEPNRLMYLIIDETKGKKLSPDELVGVVQRVSGLLPMYADNQWLIDSVSTNPESLMKFIVAAKNNSYELHSIRQGMKVLLDSMLQAEGTTPIRHFKSFVYANYETYGLKSVVS